MLYQACKGCGNMDVKYTGKDVTNKKVYTCNACGHKGVPFEGDMSKLNEFKRSLKQQKKNEEEMEVNFSSAEDEESKSDGKFKKITKLDREYDDIEFL